MEATNKEMRNKPYPYWKTIVLVMTAGWIAIWIYRTSLTPIYPQISEYFGNISDAQIGSISSLYFLGYVLMQIPSGMLVDKFGQKVVLIPGFMLFGLGALIVALASSVTMVYVGSVLAGLGCGTYYGVAYSLTGKYVPSSRRSVSTAIVNSGTAVGSGLGLIISSFFVAQIGFPWQTMMFLVVALVIILVFVFAKFIKSEKQAKDVVLEKPLVKEVVSDKAGKKAKHLFKPRMIGAYILYFSTCYAYYLTDTWLPNFLATERGFEGSTIGFASSLVFLAAIPGALIFSRVADKFYDKKIALIIFLELIAAAMMFMAVVAPGTGLMMTGLISYGFFGKLAVEPIIISWLVERVPSRGMGTTLGFFNFFGMTASVIVPSLTGFISDVTGSKVGGFYLSVFIIIFGTASFYLLNKYHEKKYA